MIVTLLVTPVMLATLVTALGNEGAWSVTFDPADVCAVRGSSVEFKCSYTYNGRETVRGAAWYKGELMNGSWTRTKLADLPSYQGRVRYVGDLQHDCGLALHNLRDADAGHYYFRFDTDAYGRRSRGSVFLSVTELSASVSPAVVTAGGHVTLECRTSCQLVSGVRWFKDGRPVTAAEFKAEIEDGGRYTCAAEGRESDAATLEVQYPPMNVSVVVSGGEQPAVGGGVNLTCLGAARPAADGYVWLKRAASGGPAQQVGAGRLLSLAPWLASHDGFYRCRVTNRHGESSSPEVLLTAKTADVERLVILVGVGVKVVVVAMLSALAVLLWRRWRQQQQRQRQRQQQQQQQRPVIDEEDDRHDYVNISTT